MAIGKRLDVKIKSCKDGSCKTEQVYFKPWYASRFKSIDEVEKYLRLHYTDLKKNSETFRDAFYASTYQQR